jgi:hypothetical protein
MPRWAKAAAGKTMPATKSTDTIILDVFMVFSFSQKNGRP